jgi:dolichyl-phosphate beta-glucosyltransferase
VARTLSIVVPAYDEERRLPDLLATLEREADAAAQHAGFELLEVIVVDDGSRDATPELLRGHAGLRTLTLERNRGKGAAVRTGMLAAAGEWALLTDVDLSTPLEDLGALAAAGADVAIGSRALPASRVLISQRRPRELLGKSFNVVLRALTGLPFRDTQCGFKLFRLSSTRPLFDEQRVDGFAFDAELCVRALRRGLAVTEVPVQWRNHPETHVGLRGAARMGVDLLRIAYWSRVAKR